MARPLVSLARLYPRIRPINHLRPIHTPFPRRQQQVEGATDISHSQFLANAGANSDFNPLQTPTAGSQTSSLQYGRLDPTNSHLFKLILPLPASLSPSTKGSDSPPESEIIPTAFLLHPSQPLSHLSRLITGSLPASQRNVEITYLALTGKEADLESHLRGAEEEPNDPELADGRLEGGPYLGEREGSKGRWQEVSWSQSTDLSDFIKQSSSLNERFKIVIRPEEKDGDVGRGDEGVTLEVVIPSFASRTTFLRQRLVKLSKDLDRLTKQKKAVDLEAHRSARRLGTTALGIGVIYWAAVVRYTFFTEAGWDMMEPVTWTTGFAALLCGTGFLIYHNREVSYSSLLDLSITARQRSLYDKHGLDIEKWTEMVAEAKTLRREIKRIAADYDLEWQGELENLASMDKYSPPSMAREETDVDRTKARGGSTKAGSKDRDDDEDNDDQKIDIDKTINEASELAEQTKERADKVKEAERKGEVVDERSEKGKKQAKVDEDEKVGAERGRQKAKKIIEK